MFNFCFLIHSVNAHLQEPIAQSSTDPLKDFIVFDEVVQLASSMTYIHVQILVNFTSINQQAEVMQKHFNNLIAHPLPDNVLKIFSKAIKTTVNFYLKPLERKMKQFINIHKNLPQKSYRVKCHVNIFKSIDPLNSEASLDYMLNSTHTKI
jgi:hypothetical protein